MRIGFTRISSELRESSNHLQNDNRTDFTMLSSQLKHIESACEGRNEILDSRWNVCVENSNHYLESLGNVSRQQTNIVELNKTGFQAIKSDLAETASSSRKAHETTHGMLGLCRSYLEEMVQHPITFRNAARVDSSQFCVSGIAGSGTLKTIRFWNYYSYTMPFGTLHISLESTHDHSPTESLAKRIYASYDIEVTFVSPSWLSNLALICNMKRDYDMITSEWYWGAKLKTLTVNSNTFFVNALENGSFEDIKMSFEKGFAQPTDYVCDNGYPFPWYKVYLKTVWQNSDKETGYLNVFEYMVDKGMSCQSVSPSIHDVKQSNLKHS